MTNKLDAGKPENLTNRGRGRPPGSVNKATKTFRETVSAMLEGNAENVQKWLETVAYGDGDQVKPDPKGALTLMAQLAEYATPKLARTEMVGDPDNPMQTVNKVVFEVVHPKG
jgi:hypothetical protein